MGTTPEWMRVLEFAGIFGLVVLVLDAIRRRKAAARWPNLVVTALMSLACGMIQVFGWRIFHGALAIIFWGAALAVFGTGFLARRAQKRAEIASSTSLHK